MSATIDQRVVQMQFDNQHFESNVSTTLSTLDKLKAKLHFGDANKSLQGLTNAANKVDFSQAEYSATKAGFQIRDVWLKTATVFEYQVANKMVNAAKNMFNSLSGLQAAMAGFTEYETQINAVQTILANTQHNGTTIDQVNAALDELNKYADMTIYNFTEMTRNIGTFTAAGIDLDTSVNAIQGIANLAAVSGSTSQQASTAMYQLSQALSAGTVRLQDWNSVVNAGMGGKVFQDALTKTSEELGTGAKAAIEASGSFRESLKNGWMTAEVLTETLKKFTTSGANEYVAEYTELSMEAVEAAIKEGEATAAAAKAKGEEADAIDLAAEALAKKSGKNKEEIKDALQMAKTATDAATKVKTFTQLKDVLKEAAQSGWAQSWRIIMGDFEEAKALFTPLSDTLTGIINKMSDWRNRILQIGLAFTEPWDAIMEKIGKIKSVADKVTSSVGDIQKLVDDVWLGKFSVRGGDPDRKKLIEELGYNYEFIQELVNLGEKSWQANERYVLSEEEIAAAAEKHGVSLQDAKAAADELSSSMGKLSDEKLIELGLTEDEIKLYRALEKESERLGISMDELTTQMSESNGRDLMIEGFKNLGSSLLGVGKAFGQAFRNIFNPAGAETLGIRLWSLMKTFERFTDSIRLTDKKTGELNERGRRFVRIFQGVLSIVKLVAIVLGGPLKIALKVVWAIIKNVTGPILELLAIVGDVATAISGWIESMLDIFIIEPLVAWVEKAIDAFREWFYSLDRSAILKSLAEFLKLCLGAIGNVLSAIAKIAPIRKFISLVKNAAVAVRDWFKSLGSGGNVFKTIGSSLKMVGSRITSWIRGLKETDDVAGYLKKSFTNAFKNIGKWLKSAYTTVKDFLLKIPGMSKVFDFLEKCFGKIGSAASSLGKVFLKVFRKIPGVGEWLDGLKESDNIVWDIIAGLAKGLSKGIKTVWNKAKEFGQTILDAIKDVLGIHSPARKLYEIAIMCIEGFVLGIGTFMGDLLTAVQNGFQPVLDWLGNLPWGKIISIAALAGIAWLIKQIGDLIGGIGAFFGQLGDLMNAAEYALKGFGKAMKGLGNYFNGKAVQAIAISILILVGALVILTLIPTDKLWDAMGVLAVVVAMVVALVGVLAAVGKGGDKTVAKMGVLILSLTAMMLTMVILLKITNSLSWEGLAKAGLCFVAFGALIWWIMKCADPFGGDFIKGAAQVAKAAALVSAVAGAILTLAFASAIFAMISWEGLGKAGAAIAVLGVIIGALIAVTKFAGPAADKAALFLAKIGATFLMLALAAKIAGGIDNEEFVRAKEVLDMFMVIVMHLLVFAMADFGKNLEQVGTFLMGVGVAFALMALTAKIAGTMSPEEMGKAAVVIAAFTGVVAALLYITKLASNKQMKSVHKVLLTMALTIALMAGIAVLLGYVDEDKLARGVTAVTILGILLAVMMSQGRMIKDAQSSLLSLAGLLLVLGGLLIILTQLDWENDWWKVLASLGVIALLFTGIWGLFKLLDKMKTSIKIDAKLFGALAGLALVIAVIGGIMIGLVVLSDNWYQHHLPSYLWISA